MQANIYIQYHLSNAAISLNSAKHFLCHVNVTVGHWTGRRLN